MSKASDYVMVVLWAHEIRAAARAMKVARLAEDAHRAAPSDETLKAAEEAFVASLQACRLVLSFYELLDDSIPIAVCEQPKRMRAVCNPGDAPSDGGAA